MCTSAGAKGEGRIITMAEQFQTCGISSVAREERATLEKMNPQQKRGIMQIQTLVCSRRCR